MTAETSDPKADKNGKEHVKPVMCDQTGKQISTDPPIMRVSLPQPSSITPSNKLRGASLLDSEDGKGKQRHIDGGDVDVDKLLARMKVESDTQKKKAIEFLLLRVVDLY